MSERRYIARLMHADLLDNLSDYQLNPMVPEYDARVVAWIIVVVLCRHTWQHTFPSLPYPDQDLHLVI